MSLRKLLKYLWSATYTQLADASAAHAPDLVRVMLIKREQLQKMLWRWLPVEQTAVEANPIDVEDVEILDQARKATGWEK